MSDFSKRHEDALDKVIKKRSKHTQTVKKGTAATQANIKINQELANALGVTIGRLDGMTKSATRVVAKTLAMGLSVKDLKINAKILEAALNGDVIALEKLKFALNTTTVEAKETGKGMFDLTNKGRLLQNSFATLRSKLLLTSFAFAMVQRTLGSLLKKYDEYERAAIQIDTAIRTTGAAALITSFEIRQMADSMERATNISRSLILQSSAVMLTFMNIGRNVFPRAIEAALDLSVAFNQDLKQSVIQVGKALNDPIIGLGALRRIGISFTNSQKEMIKNFMETNDLASAQRVILDELNAEMGDVAESMKETNLGPWTSLWNDWGNVMDSSSSKFGGFISLLPKFLSWIPKGIAATEEFATSSLEMWGAWTPRDVESRLNLLNVALNRYGKSVNELTDAEKKHLPLLEDSVDFYKQGINVLAQGGAQYEVLLDSLEKYFRGLAQLGSEEEKTMALWKKSDAGKVVTMQKNIEMVESLKAIHGATMETGDGVIDLDLLIEQLNQSMSKTSKVAQEWGVAINQAMSTMSGFIDLGSELLEKQMKADLELTKNSAEYKRAQKMKDDDKMAALEKAAMKKTLKKRQNMFLAEQAMAAANVVIQYKLAQAKGFGTAGPIFGIPLAAAMEANMWASLALIAAQTSAGMPKFAQGGDFVTSGPQMIQVGDNPGGRERVQVTPLSSPNIAGPQGGAVTVNVSGNVLSQDFVEGELAENIKEAVRRGTDFGIS